MIVLFSVFWAASKVFYIEVTSDCSPSTWIHLFTTSLPAQMVSGICNKTCYYLVKVIAYYSFDLQFPDYQGLNVWKPVTSHPLCFYCNVHSLDLIK